MYCICKLHCRPVDIYIALSTFIDAFITIGNLVEAKLLLPPSLSSYGALFIVCHIKYVHTHGTLHFVQGCLNFVFLYLTLCIVEFLSLLLSGGWLSSFHQCSQYLATSCVFLVIFLFFWSVVFICECVVLFDHRCFLFCLFYDLFSILASVFACSDCPFLFYGCVC